MLYGTNMTDTKKKSNTDAADVIRSMMHDLRGPMVNIQGFLYELREAAAYLQLLVAQEGDSIPEETRCRMEGTLESDMADCLEYLERAVQQMNSRLDECDSRLAARASVQDQAQS
tara:strand:- start:3630 stop:3974 length:345 start_codon:yes stop_codon:yes gene_type:complete